MPQLPAHLKTKAGKSYTYLGWVRAFNAANNSRRLELRGAYPDYARQYHDKLGQPRKPAKPAQAKPKYESITAGYRRARASQYHAPPEYVEHWEAAISQAKGNMARPSIQLPQLKNDLKHFQRLAKERPDNDYYPVAIASTRRQIASALDRIRAERDQLRYLAKHKPDKYLDKARYMREKRARERRYK